MFSRGVATALAMLLFGMSATAMAQYADPAQAKRKASQARGLLAKGQPAAAKSVLEQALAERPNSPTLLGAYADVMNVLGNRQASDAARFKACAFGSDEACRALKLDPMPGTTAAEATTLAGKCMAQGRTQFHARPKAAVKQFECATEAAPTSGVAWGSLALSMVRSGSARKAHVPLKQACELGHRVSCTRLDLIADLAKEKTKKKKKKPTATGGPTHTLRTTAGKTLSGRLVRKRGGYDLMQIDGTVSLTEKDVDEIFVLAEPGQAVRPLLWREGAWELGLGFGYGLGIQQVDVDGGDSSTETVHTLLGALSVGRFVTDSIEIEGLSRILGFVGDGTDSILTHWVVGSGFHFPFPGWAMVLEPQLGLEATFSDGRQGKDLETGVGPLVSGLFGVKIARQQMAVQIGLTLGYAHVFGERVNGESGEEDRIRALFEVELLWYPE